MTEEKKDQTYDLEERLIDFAVRIIRMAESLSKAKVANHNKNRKKGQKKIPMIWH